LEEHGQILSYLLINFLWKNNKLDVGLFRWRNY